MNVDSMAAAKLRAFTARMAEDDLAVDILALAHRAEATVPSYLAMRVTIYGPEELFTVVVWSVHARTAVARSSVRLEVPSGDSDHQLCIVFFAENPDAFFEFPEHVRRVSESARTPHGDRLMRLVVDDDVPKVRTAGFLVKDLSSVGTVAPVEDQGSVERAIGVLINHGFSVEAAQLELDLRAEFSHGTALEEARKLLLAEGSHHLGS